MSAPSFIEYHLICHQCGYDLYRQSHDGHCPECGVEVALAVYDAAMRAKRTPFGLTNDPRHTPLGTVAATTSYSLDAVVFLWFAYHFALESRCGPNRPSILPGRGEVDARDLCLAVRDLAVVEFGRSALPRLTEWGLDTRQGVAALTGELIRHRSLTLRRGLSLAEFAQHFEYPDCPDPVSPPSNDYNQTPSH
ncbi:MAG: hypothetical protein WD768_06970 [Phycisphaeraceae bacterium]